MQDVKAIFSVEEGTNKRTEDGKVVKFRHGTNTATIEVELNSKGSKPGSLELLDHNNNPLLPLQDAMGCRKICEYEIPKPIDNQLEQLLELNEDDDYASPPVSFNEERTLVHTEFENIKNCRASLFMGTLGILGAAGIAILGILGTKGGTEGLLAWLPCAAAIPVLLLTTAIITITHKARGLNKRQGYLEAIEELKNSGQEHLIKGWILAKSSGRKCEILQDARIRPYPMTKWGEIRWRWHRLFRKETAAEARCVANEDDIRCTDEAKGKASKINDLVQLVPDMQNSFTSICTYVYSIAFLISVTVLLWSILVMLNSTFTKKDAGSEVNSVLFWGAAAFGMGVVLLRACFKKISRWVFTIGFLIAGFVTLWFLGKDASWMALGAYSLGCLIALMASNIAYKFIEKVDALRKGRHSIDRWRYTLKIRFERCPLLNPQLLKTDPFVEIWKRKHESAPVREEKNND